MKERRKSKRKKEGNRVEIKPVSEDKVHPGKNNGFSIADDISLYGISRYKAELTEIGQTISHTRECEVGLWLNPSRFGLATRSQPK
jgi:hypothetical protein